MSGGHFDYQQYKINDIADEVQRIIEENPYEYSQRTLDEFKQGLTVLRNASIYAQRMAWLLSGDDGEETFHEHLGEELQKIDTNY
jgi:hypothetical protein